MKQPCFSVGDLVRLRPRAALRPVIGRKRLKGPFAVKSILPELHGVHGQYQYRLRGVDGLERVGLESELAPAFGEPQFRP